MNQNPTDKNNNENLSKVLTERNELEEKIKIANEKIKEKKELNEKRKELINLKKEYLTLTYSERHPIMYKLNLFFSKLFGFMNNLSKKQQEFVKKNPWD